MTWRCVSLVLLLAACWAQAATVELQQARRSRSGRVARSVSDVGTEIQVSGQRYVISTKQLDWSEAKEACEEIDMKLISLDTQDKETRIAPHFQQTYSNKHFWTSGNDITREGNFVWDSSNLPFLYRNWQSGRPQNDATRNCVELLFTGGNPGNEREYQQDWHCQNFPGQCGDSAHCAYRPIVKPTPPTAKWSDESCQKQQLFICE